MQVRAATAADIPRLVQLARMEHARSRFKDETLSAEVATHNFGHCIGGMLSKVFISENGYGFIAGFVQPSLFSKFFRAYELAWYSEDGSGLSLLGAFTDWAGKMRATDVVVSNYAAIVAQDKFERVMRRSGFDCMGSSYIKKLN